MIVYEVTQKLKNYCCEHVLGGEHVASENYCENVDHSSSRIWNELVRRVKDWKGRSGLVVLCVSAIYAYENDAAKNKGI